MDLDLVIPGRLTLNLCVKEAREASRDDEFTASRQCVLEQVLVRAVTAGKIKTEKLLSRKSFCDPSAIRFRGRGGYHVRNKACMVIGNERWKMWDVGIPVKQERMRRLTVSTEAVL